MPFDIALVELSERRFGCEVERRSHFDSCSFTRRFTYVLSLSGQFRSVGIQASIEKELEYEIDFAEKVISRAKKNRAVIRHL